MSIFKSYDEMDASHRVAYDLGALNAHPPTPTLSEEGGERPNPQMHYDGRWWTAHDDYVALEVALQAAREETRRLREALTFYAGEYGLGARLASDGGKIARDALASLAPEREARPRPDYDPPLDHPERFTDGPI